MKYEGDKEEAMAAVFRLGNTAVHQIEVPWSRLELEEDRWERDRTLVFYVDLGGNGQQCRYLEIFKWDDAGVRRLTPKWEWGHIDGVNEDGSWSASDLRCVSIHCSCHAKGLSVDRDFRPDGTEDTSGYRARLEALKVEGGLHAGLEFWLLSEILGEGPAGHAFFLTQNAGWEEELDAIEALDHRVQECDLCGWEDPAPPPSKAGARPITSRLEWMRLARRVRDEIDFGYPFGWISHDGGTVWLNESHGSRVLAGDEQVRLPEWVVRVEPAELTGDERTDWVVQTLGELRVMKGTEGSPRMLKGSCRASHWVVVDGAIHVWAEVAVCDPLMEPVARPRVREILMTYDPVRDRMTIDP
jgi:hypothetical protein